jgi:hypothetical protein
MRSTLAAFALFATSSTSAVDGEAEMGKRADDGLMPAAEIRGCALEKDQHEGVGGVSTLQPFDLQAAVVLIGPGANDAHCCEPFIEGGRRVDIGHVKSEVSEIWTHESLPEELTGLRSLRRSGARA